MAKVLKFRVKDGEGIRLGRMSQLSSKANADDFLGNPPRTVRITSYDWERKHVIGGPGYFYQVTVRFTDALPSDPCTSFAELQAMAPPDAKLEVEVIR